jgi:hypothetical protein
MQDQHSDLLVLLGFLFDVPDLLGQLLECGFEVLILRLQF